ncbi:L,D-transpeptidase YcbB [Vibrio ponticus]|nr:L,D-transpeptidase YcbB [Vibrio ponticus]
MAEERNTIIVVNVPGYQLEYWFAGEPMFESQVIVGRESRQTPVMTISLDSVVLNPTWNVPWKIMVEDIIPAVKENPAYLSEHNIKIIRSWTSSQIIDPRVVDWYGTHPKAFPFRMRQMSGEQNALGLYKFNTPNERAIFLHDTPSKHLFNEPMRAYSSGCVRVKNADQFAALLLENQGMDLAEIQQSEIEANKSIPLRQRIPVHIIYQTAWSEGGIVQYRDDIYRLDHQ